MLGLAGRQSSEDVSALLNPLVRVRFSAFLVFGEGKIDVAEI